MILLWKEPSQLIEHPPTMQLSLRLTSILAYALVIAKAAAFHAPVSAQSPIRSSVIMKSTAATSENVVDKSHLYVPSKRDAHYEGNVARYLLDLDEEGATFDFCGGEILMNGWQTLMR